MKGEILLLTEHQEKFYIQVNFVNNLTKEKILALTKAVLNLVICLNFTITLKTSNKLNVNIMKLKNTVDLVVNASVGMLMRNSKSGSVTGLGLHP